MVALARSGPVRVRGGAGEVERDHREHQPGGVGGERPRGQVRQRGVLQVGVDLLDDRVTTVGLVRGHGVEQSRSVVVKNAWNRHTSNRVSWPAASSALRSGIRRTTSRPGTCSAFFCAANAVNSISATSAREIHRPVASSKTASVYSIVVHASSLIAAIAALTCRVHPDGDRDLGAAGQGGARPRRGRRTPSPPAPAAARSGSAGARVRDGLQRVARPAASRRAADSHEPLRSRCATITGAAGGGRHGGQQRVQPADPGVAEPGALLGVAVDLDDGVVDIDQHVPVPARRPAGQQRRRAASPARNRAATASSWRTWPKVNARRNDPNVDGAYARVNTRPIPPCRSSAMSSIESAPATIPATSEATFNPAFAPLSVGHRQVLIGQAPQARGLRQTPAPGPAPPTTPDSDHRTPPTSPAACERVSPHEMPLRFGRIVTLKKSDSPATQGHSRSTARSTHPAHRWIRAKQDPRPTRRRRRQ